MECDPQCGQWNMSLTLISFPFPSARAKTLYYNKFKNRAAYRVVILSSIQGSEPDKVCYSSGLRPFQTNVGESADSLKLACGR